MSWLLESLNNRRKHFRDLPNKWYMSTQKSFLVSLGGMYFLSRVVLNHKHRKVMKRVALDLFMVSFCSSVRFIYGMSDE